VTRADRTVPITPGEMAVIVEKFHVTLMQWIQILSCYTAEARLKVAVRILLHDRGATKFQATHVELAALCCCSREHVTRALGKLRKLGIVGTARWRGQSWITARAVEAQP